MILVLGENERGPKEASDRIARHLGSAHTSLAPPQIVPADAEWNRDADWDDMLIVVYGSAKLPQSAKDYIAAFRKAHGTGAFIIPVALDAANLIPPAPISGIKAILFSGDAESLGKIRKEVGVRLGLALRPGRRKIFISYRASDGKQIASNLNDRLKNDGFDPWLDEAKENLNLGDDVQETIHDHIKDAAMVLVVDTPDAPQSDWMFEEINGAIARMISILPVIIGNNDKLSRFRSLASLRRRALAKLGGVDGGSVADAEWVAVRAEIDEVLLSGYRRRLELLSRAQEEFESRHYEWSELDRDLRMYKALRKFRVDPELPMPLTVLSHCSISRHQLASGAEGLQGLHQSTGRYRRLPAQTLPL